MKPRSPILRPLFQRAVRVALAVFRQLLVPNHPVHPQIDDPDLQSIAGQALSSAIEELETLFGADQKKWLWRDVHRTRPHHTLSAAFPELASMLDPPSVPIDGDGDTPLRSSFDRANLFDVTATSVARYIFDLGDWENSRWITPLGASGHPGSLHYADQSPLWSAVDTIPMVYDWQTIAAQAESHQVLKSLR